MCRWEKESSKDEYREGKISESTSQEEAIE